MKAGMRLHSGCSRILETAWLRYTNGPKGTALPPVHHFTLVHEGRVRCDLQQIVDIKSRRWADRWSRDDDIRDAVLSMVARARFQAFGRQDEMCVISDDDVIRAI
eukprot:14331803-Alexandrium_andersonii.AAC.1